MELAICRKCKHETIEYLPRWNWYYAICRPCYRLYMREYGAKKRKTKEYNNILCHNEKEVSYSFKCKKCLQCKRRKTISEEFTSSNSCCNDCHKPPKKRIIKEWKIYDMMRIKTNRQNPLAKQLYKQSLISNS